MINFANKERIIEGWQTDTVLTPLLPVVNIDVSQGVVTLEGVVQNEQQRQAIVSDVQRVAGGEKVIDRLQVQLPR